MKRDFTGERIGRLTVTGPAEKQGSKESYWRCRCDCGNETIVEYSNLVSGHTKSCGCAKRGRKPEDISGMRFGRLVALRPVPDEDQGRQRWECRCDCGNTCVCSKSNLKNGRTRSCGCLREDTHRETIKTSLHIVDGTCIERISNDTMFSNNTTGTRGVYRNGSGKWKAAIGFQGRVYNLGTYADYDDAVAARKEAEENLYVPFLEEYRKAHASEAETPKHKK